MNQLGPHPIVVVIGGPDTGHSAQIDRNPLVVGRGDRASLRLTDASVADAHVQLSLDDDAVLLRDLGGESGTWLGPVRLRDALLTTKTTLRIGRSYVVIAPDGANARAMIDRGYGELLADSRFGAPLLDDLSHLPYREARALALARFERAYLPSVLARTGNVVLRAAKYAGVGRGSFHRMLGRIRSSPPS